MTNATAANQEMTMTKREATEYVRRCGENDGPESYEDAAELFAAIFGRRPDDSDGDRSELWSHVCAAVESGTTTKRQIEKVTAYYDDTNDPETAGWYAMTYFRDDDGALAEGEDSMKVSFPVDLDLYGREQAGYVRDALTAAFPGAEIEVK